MTGIPSFMWLDADRLVRTALRDLERGKRVSVPGRLYRLESWLLPRLPRRLLVATGKRHPAERNR
jgi:hypothetical protein